MRGIIEGSVTGIPLDNNEGWWFLTVAVLECTVLNFSRIGGFVDAWGRLWSEKLPPHHQMSPGNRRHGSISPSPYPLKACSLPPPYYNMALVDTDSSVVGSKTSLEHIYATTKNAKTMELVSPEDCCWVVRLSGVMGPPMSKPLVVVVEVFRK